VCARNAGVTSSAESLEGEERIKYV